MQNDPSLSQPEQGVDVTADSPLPDVPDAGDDSQPIAPPEPVDISTAALHTGAAQVASTFGDQRTLYEQALDAYEDDRAPGPLASDTAESAAAVRRARIYDSQS